MFKKSARDTWLVFQRSLILNLKNPIWLALGLFQPVLYLALFAPLLDRISSAPGFPPGGTLNVFIPGLLIQLALFGPAFVGFGLIAEIQAGVVERLRVTPITRTAVLFGRSLRDVVTLIAQSLILVALAAPFGLTISVGGAILMLLLLVLIGLVMAPLSYAAALWLKREDLLAPFLILVSLPLLLLSGVLLPMSLAPPWLQTAAEVNPLSHAVNAMRAIFNSAWSDPELYWGILVMAACAAIALWVAGRVFGRRQA